MTDPYIKPDLLQRQRTRRSRRDRFELLLLVAVVVVAICGGVLVGVSTW